MKKSIVKCWLVLLALVCAGLAQAQTYPQRPIRMVIGFPPGTILDGVARPVAEEMSKKLGQPIVIEFKPGAGSTIGAKFVVAAEPDGYTLLFSAASAVLPVLNANGVDSARELVSVAHVASAPFFVLARGDLPASTLPELIAYSKAQPDRLTHGVGTASAELVMQMFKSRAGIQSRSIPYKSSVQALQAMLAGEIDLSTGTVSAFLPHIQTGRVRAVAVLSDQRSPLVPSALTPVELGLPSLEMGTNLGIWAPPGTPREIVQRLAAEVKAALALPTVAERIRKGAAAEPSANPSPEGQLRVYEMETRVWGEAAKLANFKAP